MMDKHAYLIMGHNNFYNLKVLLHLLDDERNDIYVHIDKKVKHFSPQSLSSLVKCAHIYIYSDIKVNWGGYSQVKCELLLLKNARDHLNYKYYHLLSCADLPIKSQDYIHHFFAENEGYQFVQFKDKQLREQYKELNQRVTLYHPIQEFRKCTNIRAVKGILTLFAKMIMGLQMLAHTNRLKGQETIIKYGSQWFSITDDLVGYILENENIIRHMYKLTMCPDEIFLQTLLYNSNFKDRIYQYKFQNKEQGNMREIDWDHTNDPAHPHVWVMDDLPYLLKSDMLFARKFSDSIDKKIIDRVYEELRNGYEG